MAQFGFYCQIGFLAFIVWQIYVPWQNLTNFGQQLKKLGVTFFLTQMIPPQGSGVI